MNINNIFNNLSNIIKEDNIQNKSHNFEDFYQSKLDSLNKVQLDSEKNQIEIAKGTSPNLQAAILQIDKAEMELKFALEVRNKLIEGYKQVIQTQV